MNTAINSRERDFPVSNMLSFFESKIRALGFSDQAIHELKESNRISSREINRSFAAARKTVEDESVRER